MVLLLLMCLLMISDRGWTGSSWALASQGLLAGKRGQEPSGRREATPAHTRGKGRGGTYITEVGCGSWQGRPPPPPSPHTGVRHIYTRAHWGLDNLATGP